MTALTSPGRRLPAVSASSAPLEIPHNPTFYSPCYADALLPPPTDQQEHGRTAWEVLPPSHRPIQGRQTLGLKDLCQHSAPLKLPVAAAETNQCFSRIAVLSGAKQLTVKTICFEAVNLLFRLRWHPFTSHFLQIKQAMDSTVSIAACSYCPVSRSRRLSDVS